MPGRLETADRKLLLGAAAVAVVLIGGTVALAPSNRTQESPVPSSYSSDSAGALAAYLLLVDLHYDVHRWEDAPAHLEKVGSDAILILAEPLEIPTEQERLSLREFVQEGGRILFCGPLLKAFFPEADVTPNYGYGWGDSKARLPSYFSHDARTIVMQPKARWGKLGPSQLALYGEDQEATVVAWQMGSGEVIWWAGATPLTNAGIRRAGNLRLFLNAVSDPVGERAPAIYWDEYFHGQRASLWTYFEKTPVAWGILQAAIIALAVLFTYSRRSGPIVTPAAVSRLSPLEFVDTVGSLYQSARAGSVAVSVSYQRLRLQLMRRLGLPASTSDQALSEVAGERLGWNASQFSDCMTKAAASEQQRNMRASDALELVRTLENYSAQLGIRKNIPEKN